MNHAVRLTLTALSLASASAIAQPAAPQSLIDGCNAGDSQSCANLGGFYSSLGEDPVKARAAYEKGCKLDSLSACVGLYEALSRGVGGPANPARAKALEAKVCNTGIISFDVHLKANGLCKG